MFTCLACPPLITMAISLRRSRKATASSPLEKFSCHLPPCRQKGILVSGSGHAFLRLFLCESQNSCGETGTILTGRLWISNRRPPSMTTNIHGWSKRQAGSGRGSLSGTWQVMEHSQIRFGMIPSRPRFVIQQNLPNGDNHPSAPLEELRANLEILFGIAPDRFHIYVCVSPVTIPIDPHHIL